jgi:methylthioxylose transferase
MPTGTLQPSGSRDAAGLLPGLAEVGDAVRWTVLVLAGLALTALFVALDLHLGTASAPFTGAYRFKVTLGSVLAPAVAALVLLGAARGLHERLGWGRLLLVGYAAASAWALGLAFVDGGNGLASPVTHPQEYLVDVPQVAGHPGEFLRTFVDRAGEHTVATRQHPPGPVLLLWAVRPLGLVRAESLGLALTLIGCLAVPLVVVAVRSLCGEAAARRLLPVLVLAPWAVWTAVSMDAVTTTLCAAALACGVVGSEPGRSPWWAPAAGLLLGTGALFSYAVAWLAATLLATNFLRRRPLLNVLTALGALVPLGVARLYGFVWPDGLTAAQADFSLRVGPERSWLLWIVLDLLLLAIACGPALVASLRRWRATPGWPFLVGAGLAVAFALGSGLSRGEVERSWLPFFPWLLVAAVAPEVRGGEPRRTPLLLTGLGALTAVVVQGGLATQW